MSTHVSRQHRHEDNTPTSVSPEPPSDLEVFLTESADTSFTDDMSRGEICAFISGSMKELEEIDVTTQSILEFVPGVQVVIATKAGSKSAYER